MNICSQCRHSARGHAVDMRPKVITIRKPGDPPAPNPIRPRLQGGDYICGREGLTPGRRDPVTGFEPLPSGPDCRDLNPDGRCEHFQPGWSSAEIAAAVFVVAVVLVTSAAWLVP